MRCATVSGVGHKHCSLLRWWTVIKDLNGINVPETAIVEVEDRTDPPYQEIQAAVQELGGVPAFMRTDIASNKHDMEQAAKLRRMSELDATVDGCLHFNFRHGLPFNAVVVREWLDLEHNITAFRGDTPIAEEMRFFVEDGAVKCGHFYWPEKAIEQHPPDRDDWQRQWRDTRTRTLADREIPQAMAQRVAQAVQDSDELDGPWSVDVARTTGGDWYVIDMARSELSWHPESCDRSATGDDR